MLVMLLVAIVIFILDIVSSTFSANSGCGNFNWNSGDPNELQIDASGTPICIDYPIPSFLKYRRCNDFTGNIETGIFQRHYFHCFLLFQCAVKYL